MKKVFVIGGTTFDHIVYLPQLPQPQPQTIHVAPFHEATGSTGAGKVLNLAKLGVPCALYSVIGNDVYGAKIQSFLQENCIDVYFDFDEAGTERHINIMDAEGKRISMFISQSSENVPINKAVVFKNIQEADVLVMNIIGYCKQIVPMLEGINKPIWTDLHDYDGHSSYHEPFIHSAKYIHLSSDNLSDYRSVMQKLIGMGKELVICTHGKNGATALTPDGSWTDVPSLTQYPMVDANGAGDSFFAGFITGWLQQLPLLTCMQMGTVCGALCIGSKQLSAPQLSLPLVMQLVDQHFGI